MMALEDILSQEIVQKLGWTLLHFVWQAAVVALLLTILLRVLRKSTANLRYVLACLTLGLIVLLPVITLHLVPISASYPTAPVEPAPVPSVLPMEETMQVPVAEMPVLEKPVQPVESVAITPNVSWKQRAVESLEPALPYIVSGWLVGVFGLSVWHLGGWTQMRRLRHRMVKQIGPPWQSKLKELAELLGIHRAMQLMESALVQVPTVVGWLKPVILLPASALMGLSAEQLAAILAHELAHIKRYDYLVNMLQTVVEILGFYHPAVWWVSHRIRVERENCCDDLAVTVSGDRVRYARALTSLEEMRSRQGELAVAATGGILLKRIRRLVGTGSVQNSHYGWAPAVIAVLLILALAIPATVALTSGVEKIPEGLCGSVIEGIRANRDKFKCGVLAWSRKAINDRYSDSNDPRRELAGQYELWWDGKKIATKYIQDQVYTDPTGRYRVEKQQGGNSYDGGVLSRKPRFDSSENWLGPGVTRWRGRGSQDWMILRESNMENIRKDWSVVDTNGVRLIRCMSKNMNETSQDYGAHSVSYYDPSKGYGLVNEGWYNPDGSQRLKHTVKMLEVIPGGWFPVEVDFKSFAITDGKVYSHNHHALDIERCSFNDKSALPARVFKGAVDKQLKYQQKLQKYLAMELEGISHVKEIDKENTVKLGAREAIEKFVAAAMAGDFEKAGKFAHPDKLPADHIKDVYEATKGQNLWIMAVVADDFSAIAVSSVIRGDHERIGPLVFFLDREPQDGRDNWWVHDIDMETPDSAEVELKQFLEKHPEAEKIPSEKKPTVQVEGEKESSDQDTKEVFLPDEDISPVALGLSSGKLLRVPDVNSANLASAINELGVDLAYASNETGDSKGLVFLRGATPDKQLVYLKSQNLNVYEIARDLPEVLVVTTSEGARYVVEILSADKYGCRLKYHRLDKTDAQVEGEDEKLGGAKLMEDVHVIEGLMPTIKLAIEGCLGKRPRLPRLRKKSGPGILKGIVRDTADTSYHMAYLFFVPVENWPGKPVFYYLTTVNESFEITGIPPGSYYLFAIEARNPDSIDSVGLPIDWPRPVTVYADKKVAHVEIEMSTFLSKKVRFWNQGFLRGVGHLNAENVRTEELGPYGRVVDAKGNPVPYATVQVREFKPNRGPTESIAAPDARTNEQGYYGLRPLDYPYHVGAMIYEPLINAAGYRWRYMRRNKEFEGKQAINFKFNPWPSVKNGSGTIEGIVVDDNNNLIPSFIMDVRPAESWPKVSETSELWYERWGFRVAFAAGKFALGDIPEGICNVRIMGHETSAARGVTLGKREITVSAGQAIYLKFLVKDWEKKRGERTAVRRLGRVSKQKSSGTDVQVEIENDREKGSQFTATLPNGVTVEQPTTIKVPGDYPLLQAAVDAAEDGDTIVINRGRYRGEDILIEPELEFLAWQPQRGKPNVYWESNGSVVSDKDSLKLLRRVDAVRCVDSSHRDYRWLYLCFSHPDFDFDSSAGAARILDVSNNELEQKSGHGSSAKKPEKIHGNVGWIFQTISLGTADEYPKTCTVELDYAIGKWKTVKKEIPVDFRGGMALGSNIDLGPIGQGAEGKAFVSCVRDKEKTRDVQCSFVAVTKEGGIIKSSSRLSIGSELARQEKFTFDVPLSQVKEFTFRTRPVKTARYESVSLQPVVRTDVQVEVGFEFGPVTEVVATRSDTKPNIFIDIDTGKTYEPAEVWVVGARREKMAWVKEKGIDVAVTIHEGDMCLVGNVESVLRRSFDTDWDKTTAAEVLSNRELLKDKFGFDNIQRFRRQLPATFMFKTRQGGMGLFQIVGFTDDPYGVKVRFKMARKASNRQADVQVEGENKIDKLDIETLLTKVKKALQPTDNMRVLWQFETVEPFGVGTTKSPHTVREYIATISGFKSRLEYLQKTYTSKASKDPYDIRRVTYAFDGKQCRNLEERIKGVKTTPLGWEKPQNVTVVLLYQELFACILPLHNKDKLNEYKFNLVDSGSPGIYVIKIIGPEDGIPYQITIDGSRGFNIIKTQWFGPKNRKTLEDTTVLRQYDDGIWYPAERRRIRYYPNGTHKLEHIDKFSKLELNVKVPEETFKLEFPPGTKTWDTTLEDWVIISDTDTSGKKSDVQVEVEEKILKRFFNQIDREIGKLKTKYPQLADWNTEKTDAKLFSTGKEITDRKLIYNHAVSPGNSPGYKDWCGENGCHIQIARYTGSEGPYMKTRIFHLKKGKLSVIARIITGNPEAPELEQKINDIIQSTAISAAPEPDVQVEGTGKDADADTLLEQLKSMDSVYEAGFAASGTYLNVSRFPPDVPPVRKKWRLTMLNGKTAYEEEVIEILKWEDVLGPDEDIPQARQIGGRMSWGEPMIALRSTYFVGPTAQAKYDFVGKIPPHGPLPLWPENSPGLATAGSLDLDDPNAPTYTFDVKRTLWSLGRGYSKHITNIKDVTKQENGLISVTAEGTDISYRQGAKWELVIDPSAAYMVRSAKLYRKGQNQTTISIVSSGIKWQGSRCVPEKAEWRDNYVGGRTTSNEFQSVSSKADEELLEHAEATMRSPYLLHTDVTDQRVSPERTMQFNAGKVFPKGQEPKIQN